jgi:hypothetical protein
MKIGQYGATSYHVSGHRVETNNERYIRFSSQQSDSKNPDELRKIAEFCLTKKELGVLIEELSRIHDEEDRF